MILCDTHCDTLYRLLNQPDKTCDVTMERLLQGGVSLQTMAMFVGESGDKDAVACQMNGMLKVFEQLKREGWEQALSPAEAEEGQVKMLLSIEGCEPFTDGLHRIREYYDRGVRMAAVTWNHVNALGTPACKDESAGLTEYGLKAVREMQKIGMAVDVSHLSPAGFWDILNKTDVPPMASHSCARALCDHVRNLSDGQLTRLFQKGGYVGINFCPAFLEKNGICGLDTVVDHADHMIRCGGKGKIGFGSDFDGINHKPKGLNHPRDFPALLDAFRKRGYSEEDIRDIAGLALIRYFERIKA